MTDEFIVESEEEKKNKEKKIQDLELKNIELELELKNIQENKGTIDRELDKKVVDQTIEVNKLLRHKARFIDNLSHDLATPLTPLISLLPVVRENIEDPKIKELVEVCIRNAEYIKRVVTNAKALAEVFANDLFLKNENLLEIVNELIKKYEVVFKSCNIRVDINIDQNIYVKTDKSRLLQIFDHISSNAVNSMIDGGVITFESKIIKREIGTFIQISIKDTGVGLTRDQSDRIFNEFYKVDDSRHKLDSTGLGLAICKNIVEKHGGKIWADSHGPGTGTTIHFTIPSTEVVFTRSFT